MLENVSAHESPCSGRGIDRTRKRSQVVSPYGRLTLVTIWSLVGQKLHLRKGRFWRKAVSRKFTDLVGEKDATRPAVSYDDPAE